MDFNTHKIKYKDSKGREHEIKLKSALTYPEDHPAFKAASALIDTNPELRKSAGTYFKNRQDKKNNSSPKSNQQTNTSAKTASGEELFAMGDSHELPPIPKSPTNYNGPKSDKQSLSKSPGAAKVERDVVTMLNKLNDAVQRAKDRGDTPTDYDLCEISIPGTNLFCEENLGIPREKMPQLKGRPIKGSQIEKLAKSGKVPAKIDSDGNVQFVDGEDLFKLALKATGKSLTQERERADHLKATQNQLVGSKIAGMMKAIQDDPEGPAGQAIRSPIYVSRDNYILDGHHRWGAIVALSMANGSGKPIEMDIIRVDMDARELVKFTNKFCEKMGIEQESGKTKKTPQKESVYKLLRIILS